MPVTRCKLRKQSGDARRAEQNVFPNSVDVFVCDIGIVAFDVHLDDGFGTKMFISVCSDTTFANGTEEKVWKCHWQEKPSSIFVWIFFNSLHGLSMSLSLIGLVIRQCGFGFLACWNGA